MIGSVGWVAPRPKNEVIDYSGDVG